TGAARRRSDLRIARPHPGRGRVDRPGGAGRQARRRRGRPRLLLAQGTHHPARAGARYRSRAALARLLRHLSACHEGLRSMIWVETIINGILYGGLYGLLGVGLALIVGVMRVVNLSHGEFIVLSAFIGVSLVGVFPGVHPLVLLLPVAVIAFGLGFALQAVLINRVVTRPDPFAAILLTFGVAVVMRNLMVEIYGADLRHLQA